MMDGAVACGYAKSLFDGVASGYQSSTVTTNADGSKTLTITFVNGDTANIQFSSIKGDKGDSGLGVKDVNIQTIGGSRHLIITLDDDSTIDAGILSNEQYDDTDVKADIDSLEGKEIDTLTYANSELTLTAKDTTTKTVTIKPNLVDLGDVDITSPNSGDVVTYSASTGKFITGQVSSTDQYVKMTASDTDAGYLADLIDDDTIKNNGCKLEVEKIKGQNITVDELNTLVGMNTNVKDSLNALASGGMVFKDVVPTYADLPNSAVNGFVYIVNADETDNGNRNAYIYSDDHAGFVLVGTSGLEVRNFTTNPIDLTSEVINVLPKDKMDTADLVDKTKDIINTLSYPIPDEDLEKIPNLEVLKQINTEVINALNGKVNTTDIVDNLVDNSTDKPLSANQGNVLDGKIEHKIDKSNIVTTLDDTVTDEQIASARAVLKSKSAIRMDESVNPENYEVGAWFAEGHDDILLSTSYGHPCSEWHIGYVVTGYETSDGTGYKIILAIAMSGNCYIKVQGWNTWTSWRKVCTTSVADVSITKINIINGIVNPNCNYQVKNGVCYIQLNSGTYSLGENVSGLQLATGLPIPLSGQVANTYVPWASGDASKQVILFVDGVGDLRLHAPVSANGCSVFTSFSYPVSES